MAITSKVAHAVQEGEVMTREEMAEVVELSFSIAPPRHQRDEIAAELRKTCAGCKHWDKGDEITFPHCRRGFDILFDGTGFCHRWEVK